MSASVWTQKSYFYESILDDKHRLKTKCILCGRANSAIYRWMLKEAGKTKDNVKLVCEECRDCPFGLDFHQTIYGKVQHAKS